MEENELALQQNAKTGEIFPHNAYLRYDDVSAPV